MAPSIIARVVKVLFMLIGYTARYDATKWRGGATPHALGEIGHKNAELSPWNWSSKSRELNLHLDIFIRETS
ncbi:hypothetical protein Pst134EA_032543 [Puccinia striiformis f. sp. tritici]|uniref:uncharacterized protein n=1 Tax=Puccinia striiformis f. sp. tritici TaxID=168172 RepID=UPI002007FCF6|nr:uncharacterized protein Pst134EA_032543 [Puccinia striiformis f. sp. tritici]KAH9443595.1 hypothetical protein Pst134EA_032543 [Puccinia striiformis f. sp. tritici]KAH9461774.1 hypothetical protein Pst134EB_005695 [Puccinia striiformis f. sp. tritici]KAI9623001.1 hypothetical protein KEM48_009616 [Puccinia striiformis f. sp. tritici PST-130]